MVILTMTKDSMEKIIQGRKTTTLRKNAVYWEKVFNAGHQLHLWSPSPRSGKGRFYGVARFEDFEVCPGGLLTTQDAKKDGFNSVEELLKALEKLHKMYRKEVLSHLWGIITLRLIRKEEAE